MRTDTLLSVVLTNHILLVDDEPMARRVMELLLHSWGYQVLSAGNGQEALKLAEELDIDLLVSDVIMPGMSGPELANKLNTKSSHLKVILVSGYSQEEIALQRSWKFLKKPFRPEQLKTAVEDCLK